MIVIVIRVKFQRNRSCFYMGLVWETKLLYVRSIFLPMRISNWLIHSDQLSLLSYCFLLSHLGYLMSLREEDLIQPRFHGDAVYAHRDRRDCESWKIKSGPDGPTAGKSSGHAQSGIFIADRSYGLTGQWVTGEYLVPLMREFILFTFNLWIHNEITCAVFIVHFYGVKPQASGYTTA